MGCFRDDIRRSIATVRSPSPSRSWWTGLPREEFGAVAAVEAGRMRNVVQPVYLSTYLAVVASRDVADLEKRGQR